MPIKRPARAILGSFGRRSGGSPAGGLMSWENPKVNIWMMKWASPDILGRLHSRDYRNCIHMMASEFLMTSE